MKSAKHLGLLNQRCKVGKRYLLYMVLLQEFLHPPRASRDDCGERIASVGIPLRVAGLLLFAFWDFVQSFKGPYIKVQARKTRSIYARKAHYHATSCLCYKRSYLPAVPIDPTAAGLIPVIPCATPEAPLTTGTIVITIPTPGGIRATGACGVCFCDTCCFCSGWCLRLQERSCSTFGGWWIWRQKGCSSTG